MRVDFFITEKNGDSYESNNIEMPAVPVVGNDMILPTKLIDEKQEFEGRASMVLWTYIDNIFVSIPS